MSGLIAIELLLRGAGIALSLAIGLVGLARAPREPVSWAMGCTGVCLTAYLIGSAPGFFDVEPLSTRLLSAIFPVMIWWFAMEVFEQGDWPRRVGVPVLTGLQLLTYATLVPYGLQAVCLVLAILIYSHIIWVAVAGHSDDLVEERRRLRWVILVLASVEGILFAVVELQFAPGGAPLWVGVMQTSALVMLLMATMVWLFGRRSAARPAVLDESPHPPAAEPLSAKEQAVLTRLEAAMEAGAWQREGLTIGALAEELQTGEHRLRRVINQGLGHRNFAQFINGYRVRAAQEVLGDPARADRTVLEIAHAVGFASLGPFNRAFRDITGESPSEFRADS
ncbi:Transcriptional regulator, AraC family [Candidatus Rhodobacter oscarellae]|uniref:Transcriptional regulator, AraC family n=1 Tax=Candidatus Rhodobacter oscarellae TaxID=1675527 RepID=A0A0J9EBM3_9RHOB|nr:helix-turn-helix domain-containing protein [Candidatus Rhodobacter lobularis]KMW60152.1 Transcriptional regulator, AraC family [Candidatus Rhodobacter lobularis]